MKPAQIAKEAMSVTTLAKHPNVDADFLSTGITLANLGISGTAHRGLQKGLVYRLAGQSSSGKSFWAMMMLAEASISRHFDGYDLIHDDPEHGVLMNIAKFFGKKLAERLQTIHSPSIGGFYDSIQDRLKKDKKFVWVIDSLDSLAPETETKMGDGKAKINSQQLRKVLDPLAESGSILILISQTRVDMKSMFATEIASGGRALEFYSTLDIWLRKGKAIKKEYKGKEHTIGINLLARIKKNRVSGVDQMLSFPFYPEIGIDDIGSQINYLIANKHWTLQKGVGLVSKEFGFRGKREDLAKEIEKRNGGKDLQALTAKVWGEIQAALSLERKSKYS